MCENTMCSDTNPNIEVVEMLRDALMTVCDQRKALENRRDAMGKELAALLCPFSLGETVRIPEPSAYMGHKEGILGLIMFDLNYGYQMWLTFPNGEYSSEDKVSCFQNVDIERFNHKLPVLPRERMEDLLRPLRTGRNSYY